MESIYRSKLLVCITFHYAAERIANLSEVVRALSGFIVEKMEIVICTNVEDQAILLQVANALPRSSSSFKISFFPAKELSDPLQLAWMHKGAIAEVFLKTPEFTHFIYLEDDMALSFENFCYFRCFRDELAPYGLLPSFLRVEFDRTHQRWTNSDNPSPFTSACPRVPIGDLTFISPIVPYCALYILDRELAVKHVQSNSFDPGKNPMTKIWGVREAAACGQCFEDIPPGYSSRYTIPFLETKVPAGFCCVRHLTANYANDFSNPLGKLPLNNMFGK
jgi:hypothetical protein